MPTREAPDFDRIGVKLAVLADAAKYDASCASSGVRRKGRPDGLGNVTGTGICHSYTPDGRCVSLLKILLTNFCIYDCRYCINRISSDVRRERFAIEEVGPAAARGASFPWPHQLSIPAGSGYNGG